MNENTTDPPWVADVDVFDKDAEKNLVADMQTGFGEIGKQLITGKLAERDIFEQSMADGGPSNSLDAIKNLMDYCKIGYRRLSLEVSQPRKKLQEMIDGRRSMPPEVLNKVIEVFERARPDMFGLTSAPSKGVVAAQVNRQSSETRKRNVSHFAKTIGDRSSSSQQILEATRAAAIHKKMPKK